MLKRLVTLLLVIVMVASLAGCQTSQPAATTAAPAETTTAAPAETEAPAPELSGQVIVDGSGTVYPLMAHIAEQYMTEKESNVSVQVGRAGSSAGFKKFIPGELDFSDASRKIKDSELADLEAAQGLKLGEGVLEFKLALDGLTMVINKDNDWAQEMTKDEIVNMYLAGTYRADDKVLWSDIRPEWPAEEV
ncbi:MAG: substrate-binding domain-containing protein, partial [Tissierellales bacterium]|nr:substrate-binding domain-containing protein [Tissierellales bacterium]